MILVAYTTTEGQTAKIAQFCADRLKKAGQAVTLLQLDTGAEPMPDCDAAILAASVHVGRYQDAIEGFALRNALALNKVPTLFLAVSLAAAGDDAEEWAVLERIAQGFQARTGWQAGKTCQVAGAFRFTQYDFFRRLAMRYIAWQKGEEVDPHGDREYTDWAALEAEMDSFAAQAA